MMYLLYLWLMVAGIIAIVVMAVTAQPWHATAIISLIELLLSWMLYRAIHKPLQAVKNGIYLLKEQDFSSRLRLTGQQDADKVVALFNGLMDSLKAERLKQQEQTRLLGLLIEASPMGIAICNFDDVIISRNKAYTQIVTAPLKEQLQAMADDEVRIIRTDNSQVFRCSKLWFMDSGFRRRFILVELMTEEIIRAEKRMFNKIVRTIGHEVNNTMGSVVSILDSLKSIHLSDHNLASIIDSSGESCMNLARFVNGYASLVKLPEPVPEPVELNSMMQHILPNLRASIPPNITIRLITSPSTEPVMLDEMLMQRVISNIIKNSVESIADRPDGDITIEVKHHGLEITDNGAGISPQAAGQIFTPFYSTKRPDRGLGLMLVADILRAHNASFSLSTDTYSHLTTFRIQFPGY